MKNEFILLDTGAKIKSVLENEKGKIIVSYSGGKDSDIVLNEISKYDVNKKVQFIFFDTGLEYQATKNHIRDMIAKGHNIIIERAYKTIPLTIKKEGQPFISKYVSDMLSRLQKHNFKFQEHGNLSYLELIKIYPNCIGGLKWWCDFYSSNLYEKKMENSSFNIKRHRLLKEFLINFGLPFKVSAKCCYYAKKKTSHNYEKLNNVNLTITGIRKSEGGIRAKSYKSCFIDRGDNDLSLYMPIFWWNNEFSNKYIQDNNIILSDCYTKYGLKRTGCAGCPFGKDMDKEREIIKKYEPNLSLAVENLFKDSFLWTNKYKEYRKKKTL
jgi:3'-phosphoadenosine 5'-phosphosulfate sulfotransferase (PAPS reductase)/FAD synthetase